jgi:PAS domain S-box-containing protein
MQPKDFRRYLQRTVLIPVVLLAILAVVLLWQINYMVESLRQVDHVDQVISDGRLLMRLTLDMETGLRGYLLTGDRIFLEPYHRALESQGQVFQQLQELTRSDPEQRETLERIGVRVKDWQNYADQMIQRRENGRDYQSLAVNLPGKQIMDGIRADRERMLSRAQITREQRTVGARRATRSALLTLGFLTIGIALVLMVVTHHRMTALSEAYSDLLEAERARNEEARSSREWLLTTMRSIGECVIATDPAGFIEFLNSAAEQLTGWKLREARGLPVTRVMNLFEEQTGKPIADPTEFVRTRQDGGARLSATVLARRDGERRVIEESAAPIVGASGNLHGVVLVFRDITDRRRSEAVLRSSEKLALVGRLSATIAHEIQNPLDSVMNLLYLMENTPGLPEPHRDYARSAEEELGRITQITRQLLSFNREAREPVPSDVCEIIDSVITLFAPKLTKNKIQLIRQYETHDRVLGFPGELRQVFSNLLVNAMEASSANSRIVVRVSSAHDDGRPGVRVLISDAGKGIPSSAKRDLFTPFFTTKGEKGTGLGLWVSRGIVEKHQGYIRFRSSTDGTKHGTSFLVFLPLEPAIGQIDSVA